MISKIHNLVVAEQPAAATQQKSFRISAINLFLTYPHCNLDLKLVLDQLSSKLATWEIVDYILCKEFSPAAKNDATEVAVVSKGEHIHVYIKCCKKTNIIKANFLDLEDPQNPGRIFHGKYESCRDPKKAIQYILKNITHKTDPNILFSKSLDSRINHLGGWLDFGETLIKLSEEGDVQAALDLYKKERPLDFLKNKNKLEKSFNELKLAKLGFKLKFDYSKFIVPLK